MLDLRLLHQALTLARHRHFARAADALNLTQPALSRSIASLEVALGERLFDRTRQGVEPTAFGRMLLARARVLVDEAAALERDFQLMRGLPGGELRVGAGPFAAGLSVGQAAGRLMGRYPQLQVEVVTDDLRTLVTELLQRKLDLAVVDLSLVEQHTAIVTEPLPQHAACLYCRAGHPLLQQPVCGLEQVLAFPFVGARMPPRVSPEFLQLARIGRIDADTGDYLPPIKVDSLPLAKEVVLQSDAVGAAPLALLADEVRSGRLVPLPLRADWMHTQYGFATLRDRPLSAAAQAFMAELRTVEASLQQLAAGLQAFAGIAPKAYGE